MTELTKYPDVELLLDYLKQNRGFDFTGYKRSSLVRRILKRMGMVGIEKINDYIDHLEVHPEEYSQLFNTILINVTGFYRDPQAWEYLDEHILPRIISRKKPTEQIRVWSAGCASGEEAYTISMLMVEHLGIDGFKERVKVYATDLDDDALSKARLAHYNENDIEGVPQPLLEKYFERSANGYTFLKDLRRSVIFGRHDLNQDAPISRIDLLVCRNTLMYFNAEAQARILARLNYALNDPGFLFLGKAEMLLTHVDMFTPVEIKHRVFVKVPSASLRERILVMSHNGATELNESVRLSTASFDAAPVAQIVVDPNGHLALINERARGMFNLTIRDVGRPFQELEISYRPVELRSAIEQAYALNGPVNFSDVEMPSGRGDITFVNILLTPLVVIGFGQVGINISFLDVTEPRRLQQKLEDTNHELETAMEELQSINEELETTNEELQSTVEELETTNEELQSTNEELETMNEELQSTNEELETLNDEMTQRTFELNHLNDFLEAILTSFMGGVVVIDSEYTVEVWNKKSEELWGLRAGEVLGVNFFSLDIGLPVEKLKRPIRSVMVNEHPLVELKLDATNRRGKLINCRIFCSPLVNQGKATQGVIMVVDQLNPGEE